MHNSSSATLVAYIAKVSIYLSIAKILKENRREENYRMFNVHCSPASSKWSNIRVDPEKCVAHTVEVEICDVCLGRKDSLHEYQTEDVCTFIGWVCIYKYVLGNVDDAGYAVHVSLVYHF